MVNYFSKLKWEWQAQCLGYNNEKGFLSQVGPSDQGRDVIYADAIEGEGLILSSVCGLLGNMLSLEENDHETSESGREEVQDQSNLHIYR